MESSSGATAGNWTEAAEDLVHAGQIPEAISLLESTLSILQNQTENDGKPTSSTALQLSTALHDLAKLYAAEGLSLRADQTFSRALQIKHGKGGLSFEKKDSISDDSAVASTTDGIVGHDSEKSSPNLDNDGVPQESSEVDDWEAIADRAPEELLSPVSLPGVSNLSLEDSKDQGTKRRGRGTFSYNKQGLYSDDQSHEPIIDDFESDSEVRHDGDHEKRNLLYGTRHVLVLAGFPTSTRTTDLEKLLEKFKDRFVIRWVNDTTSLAVFRTPSIALEASTSSQWPFTVRLLTEDDELLSSIPQKDLEPPRQRPQTSARTAQRLIAQSMGISLSSTFGSSELRKQEEARRNRIVSRQNMKDDAWGADDNGGRN